ncbi:MAG: PLP-dependent aminotransferase family protein [Firmicutes bacterium]|nr:PLP-dependent aminotransferase family protein [Bacillota bacterium]
MKAILPVLDDSRHEPYYMQLYRYLKQAILRGDIEEDERLPSLRSLSRSTGLSVTTIEKAYDQLLVEGYIYSRSQSGFYASRVASAGAKTVPYEDSISDRKLSFHENDLPPTPKNADASWLYDPDCFDFNKWKKCMNRVLNEHSSALFFEGSSQGESALRREIARYLYQSRGVSCSPDQIVIGAGTQQITGHLATILRSLQVEHVALEDPGYAPVRNTFRDRGFAITSVAVASDGLVLEKLPVNIRAAVYVSPSNHSFTGAVMPIGRRYELIRWAIANDSYIIEDDYDSELRYFGRPIPALKSLTDDDRVIYLGSFSSTLFAAVKISYLVLPPQIAEIFYPQLEGYSQTCSKLEQLTLAMFMETGAYLTHIRKLRKLYAQKLSLVTDILRTQGAGFIRVRSSDSGISVLLEITSSKPAEQLKKDAESLGIPVSLNGRLLLLYYNHIPEDEISGCLRRLIRLWRS